MLSFFVSRSFVLLSCFRISRGSIPATSSFALVSILGDNFSQLFLLFFAAAIQLKFSSCFPLLPSHILACRYFPASMSRLLLLSPRLFSAHSQNMFNIATVPPLSKTAARHLGCLHNISDPTCHPRSVILRSQCPDRDGVRSAWHDGVFPWRLSYLPNAVMMYRCDGKLRLVPAVPG